MGDILLKAKTIVVAANGAVAINFEWDGRSGSFTFASHAALLEAALVPVHTYWDVARLIASYWYTKDQSLTDDTKVIDKVLHINHDSNVVDITTLGPNPTLGWTQGILT